MNIREIQESKDVRMMKGLSLFSAVTYWAWYFYYQRVFPDVTDVLWIRIIISFVSGFAFYLLHLKKYPLHQIRPLIVFGLWLHIANEAHLVARNNWNPIFLVSFLGISLIVSSSVVTFKDFLVLSASAVLLPLLVHLYTPTQPSFLAHLTVATFTIYAVVGYTLKNNFSYRDEVLFHHVNSLQNSKMAALGQMASGMAHEINNPLSIIKGRSDLIAGKVAKSSHPPDREWILSEMKKISATVERIAKIIKGLRSFSRNSDGDSYTQLSVAELVQNTLELCQEKIKQKNIILKIDALPPQTVMARESQLVQVLLNLIGNAVDAVENSDTKQIKIHFLVKNSFLEIRVEDTGPPIPPHIKSRLMEPFFTTKEAGKGTGLGLSISKGILESHQGELYLDSETTGTCFVMKLPLSIATPARSQNSCT